MSTALDRPPQQPPKGTESGRDSLLAEAFLRPADCAVASLLNDKPMATSAAAPKCVETDKAGAATALVFNTDSIYQKNAQEADKRFAAMAA